MTWRKGSVVILSCGHEVTISAYIRPPFAVIKQGREWSLIHMPLRSRVYDRFYPKTLRQCKRAADALLLIDAPWHSADPRDFAALGGEFRKRAVELLEQVRP